jgi:drug/metabolite transporter (DMT)-like permease
MISLVILVNALFSLIYPIGKFSLQFCGPFTIIGLRMILGGGILLLYNYFFDRCSLRPSQKILREATILGIFNIYIANAYEFWGLRYMTSAKTCFMYNLAPFVSALIGYLYLREKMTIKKWAGLLLSLIGFLPIVLNETQGEMDLKHFWIFSSAEGALFIAVFASVIGWIYMQEAVRQKSLDGMLLNGYSMIIGGIFSLIQGCYFEPVVSAFWFKSTFWICLFSMIVISNLLAYSLYTFLLKKYTATFLCFTGLIGPLFAAWYDWIAFGISVPHSFYGATALVAIGLYFFYQEDLRQGYAI